MSTQLEIWCLHSNRICKTLGKAIAFHYKILKNKKDQWMLLVSDVEAMASGL